LKLPVPQRRKNRSTQRCALTGHEGVHRSCFRNGTQVLWLPFDWPFNKTKIRLKVQGIY